MLSLTKTVLLASCLCVLVGCTKTKEQPIQAPETEAATQSEAKTTVNSEYTQNPNWETIVVGSEINYPPFEFQDERGLPMGFEIDLLQELAKAEGFNVQFIHHNRNEMAQTLNNDKYRIWASALSISPERAATVDLTKPILTSEYVAAVLDNEKNANITTDKDLQGKTIAVSKNAKTTLEHALKVSGDQQFIVPLDTYFLTVRELFSSKADALISDKRVLDYYIAKYPDMKVKIINLDGSEQKDLAFAVKKGDGEMLNKLNSGLDKLKADGTYERLVQKWFGTTS